MDIKEQLNHIGIKIKTFAEIFGISRQTLDTYIKLYEANKKIPNERFQRIFDIVFVPPLDSIKTFSERLFKIKNSDFGNMANQLSHSSSNSTNGFGFIAYESKKDKDDNESKYLEKTIPELTIGEIAEGKAEPNYAYSNRAKDLLEFLEDSMMSYANKVEKFEEYVKKTPYYFVERFYNENHIEDYLSGYEFKDGLLINNDTKKLLKCSELLKDENVAIPEGIEIIEDEAFANNTILSVVIFPTTINRIGDHAFYNCDKLEFVIFNASRTNIHQDVVPRLSVGYRIFELSSIYAVVIYQKELIDNLRLEVRKESKFFNNSDENCFFEKGVSLHLACEIRDDVSLVDTLVVNKKTAKEKLKIYKHCCSIKNIKYDEETHNGVNFDGDIWTTLFE